MGKWICLWFDVVDVQVYAACCLAIYIRRNVRKSQVNVRMDGSPVVLEGVTFKKK